MEMSSSQGRFFVLDGPVASPGCCVLCGYSGRERRYLDPRLDFEFYGSAIFCETCVVSMAQIFGLLTPERVAEVEAERDRALTELIRLNAVSAAMEDFSVAVRAYSGETGFSSGTGGASHDATSDVPRADEVNAGDAEGESSGEPSFDVSSLGEGPDDLRDSGDSDARNSLSL